MKPPTKASIEPVAPAAARSDKEDIAQVVFTTVPNVGSSNNKHRARGRKKEADHIVAEIMQI